MYMFGFDERSKQQAANNYCSDFEAKIYEAAYFMLLLTFIVHRNQPTPSGMLSLRLSESVKCMKMNSRSIHYYTLNLQTRKERSKDMSDAGLYAHIPVENEALRHLHP